MGGLDPRIHQNMDSIQDCWIAGSTLAAYGGSPGNDESKYAERLLPPVEEAGDRDPHRQAADDEGG